MGSANLDGKYINHVFIKDVNFSPCHASLNHRVQKPLTNHHMAPGSMNSVKMSWMAWFYVNTRLFAWGIGSLGPGTAAVDMKM